jgi:signal transduction histidine kinase
MRGAALHDRQCSPSQIVFDYGAVCDAITMVAVHHQADVSAQEYRTLNLLVDRAVASALDGYADGRSRADAARDRAQAEELGVFKHELRNALYASLMAFNAIMRGPMSLHGHTGRVLERGLLRMQKLVEDSLVEVRLDAQLPPASDRIDLPQLFEELRASAEPDAVRRGLPIEVDVADGAALDGDRHLIVSAMSNLLQNALKFTRDGTHVCLRARADSSATVLEVEDRCGGLPVDRAEELFVPFAQRHGDRSGLGLGLAIVDRVAKVHGGRVVVRNLPRTGCVFALELPRAR